MNYNWIESLLYLTERRTAEITFDQHAFDRTEYYNLDLDKAEETVRTGIVIVGKCEEPNKICFERYFGKENATYCVIARFHQNFIEVKTIWPRNGR